MLVSELGVAILTFKLRSASETRCMTPQNYSHILLSISLHLLKMLSLSLRGSAAVGYDAMFH